MQTAANNNLVLTDFSSLKRVADLQAAISYGEFYQLAASCLIKGVHKEQVFRELGNRLVVLAEQAHAFRQMDILGQVCQFLMSLPLPRQYEAVGLYYQALCIHRFGRGDVEQAARLFETVTENAPPRYKARAMISLGAKPRRQGDYQTALSLYREAGRFVARSGLYDPCATLQTQRMVAVINGEDGNHRDALALLQNLFPLAHAMRSSQRSVYCDYLNSLAVELCDVGRLEEAKNVSQIVLASPFAGAYPEWRETRNEIELRGWRAPRSVVAFHQVTADAALGQTTADVASGRATPEGGKLLRLPVSERGDGPSAVEPFTASEPARLLDMQEWKKKMTKQDERPPRPTTDKEKEARLKELEKLTSREVLIKIMDNLGDERVSDDQLRRALIILEGLESWEGQWS